MRKILCLMLFVVCVFFQGIFACRRNKFNKNNKNCSLGSLVMDATGILFKDTVWLHRYLFSLDTAKIFTAFTPFYILARMNDHKLHHCFYDRPLHKNCNQLPDTFCTVINNINHIGIYILSSFALIGPTEQIRTTARVFGIGALFALVAKDLIKEIETEANLRPWNEKFCKKKRAYGGFPSGHMIEASYLATFWSLEYGLKAAIPLGILAGLSFGVLINCNRHYASQVVAGAGFGVAYGFAANKLLHKDLSERIQLRGGINHQGQSTISASFAF